MVELSKLFDLDLDSYYLYQAYETSKNCDVDGFKVGCIIFKNGEILSTGFNKIIKGDEYNLSIHAECDAIAKCAQKGMSTENSTLYCNLQPCPDCAKLIVSSKIKKVVYGCSYAISRYEIIDRESYHEKRRNEEPILVKFNYDNSKKIFEENNIELKYIDIFGLVWKIENYDE